MTIRNYHRLIDNYRVQVDTDTLPKAVQQAIYRQVKRFRKEHPKLVIRVAAVRHFGEAPPWDRTYRVAFFESEKEVTSELGPMQFAVGITVKGDLIEHYH